MTQNNWNKIVDAAFQLFMEHGYQQTTTKEIARLADVNESTVFRTFASKEELFQTTIAYYTRKSLPNDFNNLHYSGDLTQDLKYLIDSMIEVNLQLTPSFRLLVKQAHMPVEVLSEIYQSLNDQQNAYVQFIVGLSHRYPIRDLMFDAFIDAIFSTIFYHSFYYLIDQSSYKAMVKSEFSDYFVQYALTILSKERHHEA